MSMGLIFLLYMCWSSMFPIGKWLLLSSTPVFLTAARMLLAGVLLTGYVLWRKRSELKMGWKEWVSLGVLGVMSIYITNVLEFYGLEHLSAAKTCFIYSLTPFFSALLSYLHFGEKMTRNKWAGMLVGMVGMIPVFMLQTGNESLYELMFFFTLPELAVVAAAFFAVYGWVILRIMVKNREVSPLIANGVSMLIGGGLALGHSLMIDTWAPIPVTGSIVPFASVVVAATLLSNIFCYNLYGYLLRHYTATLLSFFGLLSPIFASINAWIILGETPSPLIIFSTAVVLLGAWIVYREEIRQGYIGAKNHAVSTGDR